MSESFALQQPIWVGIAFVALVALAAMRRARPVIVAGDAAGGALSVIGGTGGPREGGLLWRIGVAGAALGLAAWLLAEGTPAAVVLLAGLTLVAAGWNAASALRRREPRLSTPFTTLLVGLRLVAWLVVLTLLAQPSCRLVTTHWERPLLVALLDDSRSMSLIDGGSGASRAARVNTLLAEAASEIATLREQRDVRLLHMGADAVAGDDWRIAGEQPLSAVAGGLREAARLASRAGEAGAAAVLLIGDGAENVLDAEAVREAAAELAAQRAPLLAVGAGPPPEQTPSVELRRLALPARVGVREALHVPVAARVRGCRGAELAVELFWGEERIGRVSRKAATDDAEVTHEFEASAASPGVQRVTARVTLPAALGGAAFETSTFIEVADQRIRVLWIDGPPRQESAFALRALRGDSRLNVTYLPLFGGGDESDRAAFPRDWRDCDVVVLGAVPALALGREPLEALAQAVQREGVGLLLAGGQKLLVENARHLGALSDVCPAALDAIGPAAVRAGKTGWQFLPTDAGLGHPVLALDDGQRAGAGEWADLPPLDSAVDIDAAGPLVTTLATDQRLRPLLMVQTAGRGRCGVVAWERTWPWALASERGAERHQRLWRRLVGWLSNRRPRPWVTTDQPRYTAAGLRGGKQRVAIRAGLAGTPALGAAVDPRAMQATLSVRMVAATATRPATSSGPALAATSAPADGGNVRVPLMLVDDEWTAELPRDAAPLSRAGVYELEFEVATGGGSTAAVEEPLIARTRFEVLEVDLEQQHPTANLALLRQAAALTAASGGRFVPLEELPGLLRELANTDQRRRIETVTPYDLVDRQAWLLLGLLAGALTLEWLMRKRVRLP